MIEQVLSKEKFYELIGRRGDGFSMERRQQDVLYDVKWKKFLHHVKLFRFIPFIDFIFASGSMALGSVRDASDFDLIVGARPGRIFTVRFFALAFFGFARLRRKKNASKGEGKDKFCFNQFVTKNVEHGLRKTHVGHKPRIVYTDDLLEFHHDTHRIERMGKNL